jgi:predicted acylesterase/phospholipase RssA
MERKDLNAHLFGPGPKRILALDGGGIRGILTVQLLKRIETLVRERAGDDSAVLSDYFDLIGGTSTGAIIAAALTLGWSVERIETLYRELGNSIFESSFFRKGLLRPKFSAEPVRKALEREYGDIRLGGAELKTGLAVIAKRLDTGSPWVMHNNPKGRYFERMPGSTSTPNKDYLLCDVVRSSTAAPTYFEPEKIRVADDVEGAFVDGGVSPHNNPALQLLMLATLKGHELCWPTGADNILLVSLGTGSQTLALEQKAVMEMKAVELGVRGLSSLMDDAGALNELMLQWMSSSVTAREIDSEIGDLSGDILGGGQPLLTYLRYDVKFDDDWLKDKLKLTLDAAQLASIAEMDRAENMDTLVKIGQAASTLIEDKHFGTGFDID